MPLQCYVRSGSSRLIELSSYIVGMQHSDSYHEN
jgi:hypothetical protein